MSKYIELQEICFKTVTFSWVKTSRVPSRGCARGQWNSNANLRSKMYFKAYFLQLYNIVCMFIWYQRTRPKWVPKNVHLGHAVNFDPVLGPVECGWDRCSERERNLSIVWLPPSNPVSWYAHSRRRTYMLHHIKSGKNNTLQNFTRAKALGRSQTARILTQRSVPQSMFNVFLSADPWIQRTSSKLSQFGGRLKPGRWIPRTLKYPFCILSVSKQWESFIPII